MNDKAEFKNDVPKIPTGRAVKKLFAKPSSHQFEPLRSIDNAQNKLDSVIESFFDKQQSAFLNVSTGFGKTRAVLKALLELRSNKKVLILVPSHDLAKEICENYLKLKKEIIKDKLDGIKLSSSTMVHIVGKFNGMCDAKENINPYLAEGVNPPVSVCINCPKYNTSGCRYVEQFNSLANIRVMTHNELIDEQSAWFFGSQGGDGSSPRESRKKPDYIIVDEDWLKADNHAATFKSRIKCIGNVIDDLRETDDLITAIKKHKSDISADYQKYKNTKYPKFEGNDNYIQQYKEINAEYIDLKILEAFNNYLKSGDEHEISRMFYDKKSRELHYYNLHKIAERYSDVPILFLDATANEDLVKEVIGDIEFHSIKVKQSDDINVYQAENFNITKSWLEKDKNLKRLVRFLNETKEKYELIGFITYQNIKTRKHFDDWLAAECGIETYGHFNGIRGLNKFVNLDCLIIIGRQLIKQIDTLNIAQAVFGERLSESQSTLDTSIRMKDGSSCSIPNYIYDDPRLELVKEHFSRSETSQAIGRARLIGHKKSKTNKPKVIFLLSKESMGTDLEISKFIREEDVLRELKYEDAADRLKEIGYCKNVPKDLKINLLLSGSSIGKDREGITAEFLNAGIEKVDLKYKDKHRNPKTPSYYVSDKFSLLEHIEEIGGTSIVMS